MRLWKAYACGLLRSPLFWISLFLTALTGSFHLIYQPMNTNEAVTTFEIFINVDAYRKLLPFLTALPFAAQFAKEWKSRFFDSILYRSNFHGYVRTHIAVCAVSSFSVCFLGMILFFIYASIRQPIYTGGYYPVPPYGFWLAKGLPIMFILTHAFIFSLSCTMWSICGLAVSALFPNVYVALSAPFICSYLVEHLTNRCPSYLRFYSMALGGQILSTESGISNFLYTLLFYAFWITVFALIFRMILGKRVRNEIH